MTFLSSEVVSAATISFLLGWSLQRSGIIHKLRGLRLSKKLTENSNFKLVIVVRPDLRMSTGKIASQCSHAALACYKQGLNVHPNIVKQWEYLGQPKVILRANPGENSLIELGKKATKAGLVAAVIRDAGRTQVAQGSATVLGIGPDLVEKVDGVTSDLKLL